MTLFVFSRIPWTFRWLCSGKSLAAMSSDDLQTSQHGFRSDRQTIGRRFVEIVTASRAKYYGAISEVRYSDRSSALRSLKLWSHLVNALPYLSCTCVIRKGEAYLPLELPAKGRNNRGTFLPSVWENYPQAESFLKHLKMKAGLPASYWSGTIKVERYETVSW